MSLNRLLICLGGHPAVDPAPGDAPAERRRCSQCGAAIIGTCPGCREPILGVPASAQPGAQPPAPDLGAERLSPPRYCHCCGRPFPWTERVVSAVRTAIRQIGMLDAHERDQLRRSIDHIIHQTPQTRLAVVRINEALARIGGETAVTLRELLMSVATDGVRQQLALPTQAETSTS